jgi:hypothetical protein
VVMFGSDMMVGHFAVFSSSGAKVNLDRLLKKFIFRPIALGVYDIWEDGAFQI